MVKPAFSWRDNRLLTLVSAADMQLLEPAIKLVVHDENEILYRPGSNVEQIYFPCQRTLVSYVVDLSNGQSVETAIVGNEGAVGGIVSQGHLPAYTRIMVQSGGLFAVIPVTVVEKAKCASRSLDSLFARYADCLLAQVFQNIACNAVHSVEARLAKWMMATAEHAQTHEIPVTHERLAGLLGVGRPYVSRVLGDLRRLGVVETRRSRLVIKKHGELEKLACECNAAVRQHFDQVLRGAYKDWTAVS